MEKAFRNGLWLYWITPTSIICVEQPSLSIEGNRLHRSDGPAVEWPAGERYWFWRGTQVPPEWIERPLDLTPSVALSWMNVEQRRAACEIIGWGRLLSALDARVIDQDADDEIGQLVEVALPDSGRERFLRVRCGTGRFFAIPVPRDMKTAIQAQAWTYGLTTDQFKPPETRT